MNARDILDTLRAAKDGPVKKFQLIKAFGVMLRDRGLDPHVMSCTELETHISAILDGDAQ